MKTAINICIIIKNNLSNTTKEYTIYLYILI